MFVQPQNVISHLELSHGMIVADFGCASGYYSIPLAKAVGSTGKIYAYDLRKDMLEIVRSRARLEHLLNIDVIWADLEISGATKLQDETVDAIVISNILFQISDKQPMLKEAARVTKKGGLALAIEWDESRGIGGPPMQDRLSRQETKQIFEKNNFDFEKEFNAGDRHFGLLFKKR